MIDADLKMILGIGKAEGRARSAECRVQRAECRVFRPKKAK